MSADVNRAPGGTGTSPRTGRWIADAARTVISEMSVRLLPPVWPIVEIHTSR